MFGQSSKAIHTGVQAAPKKADGITVELKGNRNLHLHWLTFQGVLATAPPTHWVLMLPSGLMG